MVAQDAGLRDKASKLAAQWNESDYETAIAMDQPGTARPQVKESNIHGAVTQ